MSVGSTDHPGAKEILHPCHVARRPTRHDLHVAQPSLSEQIRNLERELGVQLLERVNHRVTLTDAGHALLLDARGILRHADVAFRSAVRAERAVALRLRAGYCTDVMPAEIPKALDRLRRQDDEIDTQLEPGTTLSLLADVRADRLDAAFVCLPAPVSGLRTIEVATESLVVAVPSRRWLRSLDEVPLHALLEVIAGNAVALLPSSAAARWTSEMVVFRPIADCPVQVRVALAYRDAALRAALQALLRTLGGPAPATGRLLQAA